MDRYTNGAFVFTRARGLTPRKPEDIIPIAERHGINPSVIPPYAGDRAAVGRAIARTDTKIAGDTFLLRPIRRSRSEVVYGIVREDKSGDDHLDHDHEATVSWKAEPDSAAIEGDHTIANRIRLTYRELRGKLVTDDWTSCVTAELENLGAVPFREDGRVYWVPPQSLDDVKRLREFLAEVGVVLVLAEVESETTGVVTEVVAESVEEQLHRLELEVQDFDERQKPSMFARRLEVYQELRQKALLYQSALGIGAERTEQVLAELERKVSAMLDVRQGLTVHRDGSVTKKGEAKTAETPTESEPADSPTITTLTFAGATFTQAGSDVDGELLFTSSDEHAVSSVRALEAMGLAGKWQKAGNVEVVLQNSGPPGAETSIRLKLPEGVGLAKAGKALEALGIGVA